MFTVDAATYPHTRSETSKFPPHNTHTHKRTLTGKNKAKNNMEFLGNFQKLVVRQGKLTHPNVKSF